MYESQCAQEPAEPAGVLSSPAMQHHACPECSHEPEPGALPSPAVQRFAWPEIHAPKYMKCSGDSAILIVVTLPHANARSSEAATTSCVVKTPHII